MKRPETLIRINKYLADKEISTRRGADILITQGDVLINGRRALVGQKVSIKDRVEVKRNASTTPYIYLAYHKPRGMITHSAARGEGEIPRTASVRGKKIKVFPLGRLDKDSSGLIILTNDGRATNRLLNPQYEHKKTYAVELDKPTTNHSIKWLSRGVLIEGYTTKPASTVRIGPRKIELTLSEGKKHQIRRMCAALGFQVKNLLRTRIENISLGNLSPGEVREIEGRERLEFLTILGL